jgi:hypothetical protein
LKSRPDSSPFTTDRKLGFGRVGLGFFVSVLRLARSLRFGLTRRSAAFMTP